MNRCALQITLLFICGLLPGRSSGAECWRLVYVASETRTDSGSASTGGGQIVYDVQYSACTATEPNTPGQCSCYPSRRAVGRYWAVRLQRSVDRLDLGPSARAYLWRLTVSPGKDTDTERVIMRRIRNRLAGTPCKEETDVKGTVEIVKDRK